MKHTTVRTQMPSMPIKTSHGPVATKTKESVKVSVPRSTTFDGMQKPHGKSAR